MSKKKKQNAELQEWLKDPEAMKNFIKQADIFENWVNTFIGRYEQEGLKLGSNLNAYFADVDAEVKMGVIIDCFKKIVKEDPNSQTGIKNIVEFCDYMIEELQDHLQDPKIVKGRSSKSIQLKFFKRLKQEIQKIPVVAKTQPSPPNHIKEIFVDSEQGNYILYLEILRRVGPAAVIDANNNYLLGPREKTSIAAWYRALKIKGKLKHFSVAILVPVFNSTFKGLDLGKDGKTLGATSGSAYNKYYKNILQEVN